MCDRVDAKIATLRKVLGSVFTPTHHAKIFYSIVKFVTVNVVNYLIRLEHTTNIFFNNKAMFSYITPVSIWVRCSNSGKPVTLYGDVAPAPPIGTISKSADALTVFRNFVSGLASVGLALKWMAISPSTFSYGQVVALSKIRQCRHMATKEVSHISVSKPFIVIKALKVGKGNLAPNSMSHTPYCSLTLNYSQ